jgi:integrase
MRSARTARPCSAIRTVPLNSSALEVLSQVGTEGRNDHVFVNAETGKGYVSIAKVWGRLRKAAGLPHLRLHDLRHSFASLLANKGESLLVIQQLLGHSDHKVTERYAHLNQKTLQEASDVASFAINGTSRGELKESA